MGTRSIAITAALALWIGRGALAGGIIARAAPDGAWARFEGTRTNTKPTGEETAGPETVTISFVGTTQIDGESCRWIEIATELTQDNGKKFTEVQKLLIPQKHLTGTDDPLEHVKKAWRWNSVVPRERALTELNRDEVRTWRILRTWVRPYLREPLADEARVEAGRIECMFGEVDCVGLAGTERGVEPLTGIVTESKFLLRLHPDAPFGVAAWEHELKLSKDEPFGTTTTRLRLVKVGKDGKSALPDAN